MPPEIFIMPMTMVILLSWNSSFCRWSLRECVIGIYWCSVFWEVPLGRKAWPELFSSVQAECEILKGPHGNLQGFLDAVDLLRNIEGYISSTKSYSNSDGMLSHVNALLCKALVRIEGEFQKQLSQHRFLSHNCQFNFWFSTLASSNSCVLQLFQQAYRAWLSF